MINTAPSNTRFAVFRMTPTAARFRRFPILSATTPEIRPSPKRTTPTMNNPGSISVTRAPAIDSPIEPVAQSMDHVRGTGDTSGTIGAAPTTIFCV
jgi:hypothetical protein